LIISGKGGVLQGFEGIARFLARFNLDLWTLSEMEMEMEMEMDRRVVRA
jgi:hypothetical protein